MEATITLRDGSTATIKGLKFHPKAAPDVTLIAHPDLTNKPGMRRWMVTEVVTGYGCLKRPATTRQNAIEQAEENFGYPGAADHARKQIAAAREVVSAQ